MFQMFLRKRQSQERSKALLTVINMEHLGNYQQPGNSRDELPRPIQLGDAVETRQRYRWKILKFIQRVKTLTQLVLRMAFQQAKLNGCGKSQ